MPRVLIILRSGFGSRCVEPAKIGVIWNENVDNVLSNFREIVQVYKNLPITKRNLLKILATFYDQVTYNLLLSLKVLF